MRHQTQEENVKQFNQDVLLNAGYLYTTAAKLSSRLANQRLTEAVRQIADLTGKEIIDVGCGDGTYTIELLTAGASRILGVDAAEAAVSIAKQKFAGIGNIEFLTADIYNLNSLGRRFDVAIVRGVLHHLYDLEKAIESLSHVAAEIIVIEPNGYSPILKLIERTSKYHIEHEEKSYTLHKVKIHFEKHGGQLVSSFYCGLVPMFCPDFFAKALKKVEPFVERIPLLRQLLCAVYVLKFRFTHNDR